MTSLDTLIRNGNTHLLELAAFIESYQKAKDKAGDDDTYDQGAEFHHCGSPACALGHAAMLYNYNLDAKGQPQVAYYNEGDQDWAREMFALSLAQYVRIFSTHGCGDAHRDYTQAVAFIRNFVKERKI